jgi:hypothetical protein
VGGRVKLEHECPKESLKLSLPGSCKILISILESNPDHFSLSRPMRLSEVDADAAKVTHLGVGGMCQI